jgi:predicted transcriptional regulator
MRFQLKNLRLDEEGLSTVLGFLEAEIMDAVWDHGDTSVRDVREVLAGKKEYSFNTIMTVMNRLVAKKLLTKKQSDGTFAYRAAIAREEFSREVSRSVASALVAGGSLFQAAAFVEALKAGSSDDLRKLKEIIDQEG